MIPVIVERNLQTGVYLSVERSNTVTRPSPDTVAKTVLVLKQLAVPSIRIREIPQSQRKTKNWTNWGSVVAIWGVETCTWVPRIWSP